MSGLVAGVPREVAGRRHGGRRLMKADGTPPDEKHRHGIRWSDEEWSWVEAEVAKIGGAKIKTRKR